MNTIALLVLVAVLVDSAFSVPAQRMKRWSMHRTIVEPAPGLSGADLAEVLATTSDIRYSDREKHLTALKNGKFKACFIVDLDTDFYLMEQEMDKITTEKAPKVVNNPPTYYELLGKAGPLLTPMCEKMDIYWLNAATPPLPVDIKPPNKIAPPIPEARPLPVNHDPPTPPRLQQNPEIPSLVNLNPPTPPPVEKSDGHVKAPPPLSMYHPQLANQNVRQEERPVMTPPPLALWKLQHGK